MNRFLETITIFENDVLVPIDKIQYIQRKETDKDYQIIIKGEGSFQWIECFNCEKKFNKRYEEIKEIIGAK